MKFTLRHTTTTRQELSIGDLLFASPLAALVCGQQDTSPGAILLDHLVPNRWPGESFDGWLLRQTREILVAHVQTDDWEEECGRRTQRTLEGIELDDHDRRWLLERFGRHPEVMAVWEDACRPEGRHAAA